MENLLSITIKEIFDLEKEKRDLKANEKDINEQIAKKKLAVLEIMDNDEITEITIDGVKVKRAVVTSYSIDTHTWSDPRFMEWLKKNGYEDIIKQTVHPATKDKILSEFRDAGNELPEFIHDNYFDTIKYSTTKIK